MILEGQVKCFKIINIIYKKSKYDFCLWYLKDKLNVSKL